MVNYFFSGISSAIRYICHTIAILILVMMMMLVLFDYNHCALDSVQEHYNALPNPSSLHFNWVLIKPTMIRVNCCARAPPISLIRCQRPRKCPAPSCEPVFHDCQLCPKENRHQIVPPKKQSKIRSVENTPRVFRFTPPVQSAMSSLTGFSLRSLRSLCLTLPKNPGSGIPEV